MGRNNSRSFYVRFVKRFADIVIGLVAMPFLAVVVLIVGLAIKLDDGGPVFYKAKRIGKDCKIFDMYKFRSMIVNAPNWTNQDGSTYNAPDDDRVTRVGKFIRKTSIDELPQFFNVLIGNMTLIGPRASGAGALGNYQPDELEKMEVKPGITGFTQAYYRNGLSVREKRLQDAWYAHNVTLWLDIKIFLKTFITVLTSREVYTNQAGTSKDTLYIDNSTETKEEVTTK